MKHFHVIILAAGNRAHPEDSGDGKISKLLADINGIPAIRKLINTVIAAGIPGHRITVVVKRSLEANFRKVFEGTDVRLAFQNVARGSADAVRLVLEQGALSPCKHFLLLMGDQVNITPGTILQLMTRHRRKGPLVTVTTFTGDRRHPAFTKCGVISTDAVGNFKIHRPKPEENTANMLMHAGPYAIQRSWLQECIGHIDWSRETETHVYVVVAAAAALGKGVDVLHVPDQWEVLGTDTFASLTAIRENNRDFLNH